MSNSLDWDTGDSSNAFSSTSSATSDAGVFDDGEDVAPSDQQSVAIKVSGDAPTSMPLGYNSTSAIVAQIISSAPESYDPAAMNAGTGVPILEKEQEELLKEEVRVPKTFWQKLPLQQLVVEFSGAYFLTWFAIIIGYNPDRMHLVGFAAAVMLYLAGHISGGHFNPAITLSVYLRGKLNKEMCLAYILMQILGAIFGSLMTWGWYFHHGIGAALVTRPLILTPHPHFGFFDFCFVEFFYTLILCILFLTLTSTRANQDNEHYEIMYGIYYAGAIAVAGNITRGFLNPAIAIGLAISSALEDGSGSAPDTWAYLLFELLAAVVAAGWFRVINRKDNDHKLLPPTGRNQNIHMQGTY